MTAKATQTKTKRIKAVDVKSVPVTPKNGDSKVERITLFPPDSSESISKLEQRRSRNLKTFIVKLAAFVVLPTLLAAMYYTFIATDRYVSEMHLTVQSPSSSGVVSVVGSLLGGGGGGGANEIFVVEEYIQSITMLQKLDETLDLRAHYSQEWINSMSRLAPDATDEVFLSYYQSMIVVEVNPDTSILAVKLQAFTPDMAKVIADVITALCEDLVNNLNDRSRRDALEFARKELTLAEDKFRNIRGRISEFRNREGDLNPANSAAAITTIVNSLEAQISETSVKLAGLKSYMQPSTVAIKALESRLAALQTQVADERKKLVTTGASVGDKRLYAELVSEYENLMIEEEIARSTYQTMTQAYQAARAESAKGQYIYLAAFVPATLPTESLEPKRLRSVFVVFLLSIIFLMVGSFTWSAVREHMDI